MHRASSFALDGVVGAHLHAHLAAAHVGDGGIEFAARSFRGAQAAMEQRDRLARLHAQHLNMARRACRQGHFQPGDQVCRAVKTWHVL